MNNICSFWDPANRFRSTSWRKSCPLTFKYWCLSGLRASPNTSERMPLSHTKLTRTKVSLRNRRQPNGAK